MTSSSLAWGTAIGIALAIAYAASPLTVWFAIAMIGLFVWAGRGLGERERRYVIGILAAAVAIRLLAIVVLFLVTNHHLPVSFFWDGDGVYLKYRALVIRDVWIGAPVSQADYSTAFNRIYGWTSYLYVLAYLQYLTAPSPYGVHLFNVTLFVGAAVMLHRLVRSAYGRAPALLGLALMLLLPTLIAWSSSALKESLYVFLCAVGLVAAVAAVRAVRLRDRAFAIALVVAAIAANRTVRMGASFIMMTGLAAGIAGSIILRRVALVMLLVILLPLAVVGLWEHPGVRAQIGTRIRAAATLHMGNVRTEGHFYKLLDQRIYSEEGGIKTMTAAEGARFVVRAIASFVAVPLPWQITSRAEIVYLPQQVVWYILVVLACVGFLAGLRRDALVTCLLAGLSAAGGITIALNSGNIGTMARFRDTIVPFVVWLSAVGAVSTVSRLASRRVVSGDRAYRSHVPAATPIEATSE